MTSVEKFAMIPHSKYQQLLQAQHTTRAPTNQTAETAQGNNRAAGSVQGNNRPDRSNQPQTHLQPSGVQSAGRPPPGLPSDDLMLLSKKQKMDRIVTDDKNEIEGDIDSESEQGSESGDSEATDWIGYWEEL